MAIGTSLLGVSVLVVSTIVIYHETFGNYYSPEFGTVDDLPQTQDSFLAYNPSAGGLVFRSHLHELYDLDRDTRIATESGPGMDEDQITMHVDGIPSATFHSTKGVTFHQRQNATANPDGRVFGTSAAGRTLLALEAANISSASIVLEDAQAEPNTLTLCTPPDQGGDFTYEFPAVMPTPGQVLSATTAPDINGIVPLQWSTPATGGSTLGPGSPDSLPYWTTTTTLGDSAFFENTATYGASSGKNAYFQSGDFSVLTTSGGITLDSTGFTAQTTASQIHLNSDTIKLNTASSAPTVGQVWTATNADGSGAWQGIAFPATVGTANRFAIFDATGDLADDVDFRYDGSFVYHNRPLSLGSSSNEGYVRMFTGTPTGTMTIRPAIGSTSTWTLRMPAAQATSLGQVLQVTSAGLVTETAWATPAVPYTGTANRLAVFDGSNTLTTDAAFTFDATFAYVDKALVLGAAGSAGRLRIQTGNGATGAWEIQTASSQTSAFVLQLPTTAGAVGNVLTVTSAGLVTETAWQAPSAVAPTGTANSIAYFDATNTLVQDAAALGYDDTANTMTFLTSNINMQATSTLSLTGNGGIDMQTNSPSTWNLFRVNVNVGAYEMRGYTSTTTPLIRMYESTTNGAEYFGFQAPNIAASNSQMISWPASRPTADGQVLTVQSGSNSLNVQLEWANPTGGTSDRIEDATTSVVADGTSDTVTVTVDGVDKMHVSRLPAEGELKLLTGARIRFQRPAGTGFEPYLRASGNAATADYGFNLPTQVNGDNTGKTLYIASDGNANGNGGEFALELIDLPLFRAGGTPTAGIHSVVGSDNSFIVTVVGGLTSSFTVSWANTRPGSYLVTCTINSAVARYVTSTTKGAATWDFIIGGGSIDTGDEVMCVAHDL